MKSSIPSIAIIILVFYLSGCSSHKEEATPILDASILTSSDNYLDEALPQNISAKNDGFLGLIKLYVEHGFKDNEGEKGSFIAKGAGSIVIKNGKWYVITAKHLVEPKTDLKSIEIKCKDESREIKFESINKSAVSILVGSTSVEPTTIWLPTDHNFDVAVLEIEQTKYQSLIIDTLHVLYTSSKNMTPGQNVKAWGYPGRQAPQYKDLGISQIYPDYFILNGALEHGYSGGLVFSSTGNEEEAIAGMITRADNESNQSTILKWSSVTSMLNAVVNKTSNVKSVALGDSIPYNGVLIHFAELHKFPYASPCK